MASRALKVVGWGGSVALAMYVGGRIERTSLRAEAPADLAREAASSSTRPAPIVLSAGGGVDPEQLRRIVREEIAAGRAVPPAAADPEGQQAPAGPPPPSTGEAQTHLRDATVLIDNAIANRRWTRDDRKNWLAILRQPDVPPAVFELQRKLIAAMNRGDVASSAGGAPFSPFFPQL